MRRRRPLDVWPAFADLMTVLAIVGLFTTLALTHHGEDQEKLISQVKNLERQRRELQEKLAHQRREQGVKEEQWNKERQDSQRQIQEAARNERMFKAIQEAQRLIEDISLGSGLLFGADQSLQFGDDLVSFELSSVKPIWKKDSRERLKRFCEAISRQLSKRQESSQELGQLFLVQVEGHTDASQCSEDPDCNWWISSGRAAAFVAFMRQPRYCPGGGMLNLAPVGYAETKPLYEGAEPTRRITVRLAPNYESIIRTLTGGA